MSNYNTEKKKHKVKSHSVGMILPLYIFTILFVACPLIYMVALSFATPGAVHGVEWIFTLDNYKKILEPVYLNTFVQSFKLAVTSTLIIGLVGYPFGYFMAKLPAGKKKKAMLILMLPFWVNSLIRLYGWIIILQKKGILNFVLKKLGIIDKSLKLLYSYPAIVVGIRASSFYDPVCVFQCRKDGLVIGRGSQRSGRRKDQSILDDHLEAYPARPVIWCDPYFRAVHGTVLYSRHFGWK